MIERELLEELLHDMIHTLVSLPSQTTYDTLRSIHRRAYEIGIRVPGNEVDFWRKATSEPLELMLDLSSLGEMAKDAVSKPLFLHERLSEECIAFFYDYQAVRDRWSHEQERMREILFHCLDQEDRISSEELYRLIRVKLYNKSYVKDGRLRPPKEAEPNILTEQEMEKYLMGFDDRTLSLMVRSLYQEEYGPKMWIICPHCCLPMIDANNCRNNSVCFETRKKRTPQTYQVGTGEKVYIPKDGVCYYNVLPGLEEYRLYWSLKTRYRHIEVSLFPNLELDGDIQLQCGHRTLNIDVKDYRNPSDLVKKIQEEYDRFRRKDILYIPSHRIDPSYLQIVQEGLRRMAASRGEQPLLKVVRGRGIYQAADQWLEMEVSV